MYTADITLGKFAIDTVRMNTDAFQGYPTN